MARLIVIGLLLTLLQLPLMAQAEWTLLKTIPIREGITATGIDSDGRIYVGTAAGNLHRFSADGTESEFFSGIANFPVTSVAAWNRLKVFIFFRDPQQFYYLDRFNTVSTTYSLNTYESELSWLCSPGVDNSLWVLNVGYNELRKYNDQTSQLLLSTPLTIDLNTATQIRAYQNLLIISDSTQGIFFFDQYGSELRHIPQKGVNSFQVLNGKLIFFAGGYIHLMDTFDPEKEETIKAPEGAFRDVLQSGERYVFTQSHQLLIYTRQL